MDGFALRLPRSSWKGFIDRKFVHVECCGSLGHERSLEVTSAPVVQQAPSPAKYRDHCYRFPGAQSTQDVFPVPSSPSHPLLLFFILSVAPRRLASFYI